MAPVLMKTLAAIVAVAGLGIASVESILAGSAYDGGQITALTESEITAHAERVFARADVDANAALDVDEFTALTVVTAELARLNGFIVVELGDQPGVIELPVVSPSALPRSEHIRVAAVAQRRFYVFAGADGKMSADEFAAAQGALFDAADRNGNGRLGRRELSAYAQRHASMSAGV